jgi:hypothetical protein
MKYATIVKESNAIFQQYNMALTLRQLFYRLVAKHIIANTVQNYKYLSRIVVRARERGDIDDRWIEDRTRTTIGGDFGWDDCDKFLNEQLAQLKQSHLRFTMPMWTNQNVVVEVWVEKDALSRVISDVAKGFRVITCPSKGYSSYTYLKTAIERMQSEYLPEQDIWILYFGDYDPSGVDIERDLSQRLMQYGAPPNFQGVKRVALTLDQIRHYQLPPMPAKRSDPRLARFIADTGGSDAVELDALEPPILQKLVENAISQHIDVEKWNQRLAEIEEKKKLLEGKLAKMRILFEEDQNG